MSQGPVPKRSDMRLGHRSKAEAAAVDRAPAGPRESPEPDPAWHPIAWSWFVALGRSGQSVFFEPSDWATARYVAEAMSQNLAAGKFSAMLFSSVMQATSGLMCTEGDRRRLRLELERAPKVDLDEAEAVASMAAYRAKLG